MLDQYVTQGCVDALNQFGFTKLAIQLGTAGPKPTARGVKVTPHAEGGFTLKTPGGGRMGTPNVLADPHTQAAMDTHTAPTTAPAAADAAGGLMSKVKGFGQGQWGAAKSLFGELGQGFGGAATPEAGMAARGRMLGNLKTLTPSLLAGGALYMMHRGNQAERDRQRQQGLMQGGGY